VKHLKQFENQEAIILDEFDLNQDVKLFIVQEVLIEALQDNEIDMIKVNIAEIMERIAEYPLHSKTVKKYNV